MRQGILKVKDVSLNFGGVQALSGVSFEVRQGEIFSIIGPNGAGKTTLFDCISGRYLTSGSIRIAGVELVGKKAHLRPKLGIVRTFQNIALFPNETVIDNVLVGRDHLLKSGVLKTCLFWTRWGCSREEALSRQQAVETLGVVGLAELKDTPVADLPYGTQKRVELARALVSNPNLMLLDEPMAGMTMSEKKDLALIVKKLNAQQGVTVVMIEHDMGTVLEISDRVMVLDFGQKIAEGLPVVVMADQTVRKAYLGEAT